MIDKGNYYLSLEPQGSDEWHKLRQGKLTMSNCLAILGKSPYLTKDQVYQQIIGKVKVVINDDMIRGTTKEPVARQWYVEYSGKPVEEVGLAILKDNNKIGASVDGLVGLDGMIEIKCPRAMYRCLSESDRILDSHYYQIQGCLWVLDRQWCDYVVYTDQQVCVKRVFPDPTVIEEIKQGFYQFIEQYQL